MVVGERGSPAAARSRSRSRRDPAALQRWKRSWFVLYPASQHGVARLEFFDCKEPSASGRLGTRRLDKTVVRLADCTSVAPVPESGPRAGTAVFRLETSGRSYLLAADKEQSEEWVAKLCEIAFPVSPRRGGAGGGGPAGGTGSAGWESPGRSERRALRLRSALGGSRRAGSPVAHRTAARCQSFLVAAPNSRSGSSPAVRMVSLPPPETCRGPGDG